VAITFAGTASGWLELHGGRFGEANRQGLDNVNAPVRVGPALQVASDRNSVAVSTERSIAEFL
jgi:hypothetical protein